MSDAELIDSIRRFSRRLSAPHSSNGKLRRSLITSSSLPRSSARRGPQFEADGGAVMVVIVHSGHLSFDCRKGHSTYRVTATPPVAAQKQLPPTGSGVKNEDYWNWNYSISYQEVMNMFDNGGNGTLDFDARYKEDFSRREPLTGITLSNGVEFGTKFESDNTDPPKFNLAGVSIFRANTPDAFPAKFSFEANSAWGFVEEGFSSNKKVEVQVDINRDV
ncbi:hypothetical protein AB1N83_013499 [Pleurotus pulmonarius]